MATINQQRSALARLPRRQRGLSLISGLYVLMTLAAIALIAIRSVPVYLNDRDIQNALEDVAHNPALQNADPIQIKRAIGKHFNAGYASGVSAKDVHIFNDGATRRLELHYQVRRPLVANVGLVYSFDDVARMQAGGGG
ncbi:DUF4845 domain-containing protein [Salinisphaera sp. SPP-AMP-43]|uniref:DUF4845 domain-containing protein n=1 Tax=Salinisphaera sp. SPP-AMP-43 TaxID=3121288 RepID=UPI003C6E8134